MGFSLKKLFSPVTNAVRGLGRLARGKVKEGFSDIGGAARFAAPVLGLTGVGLPIAALIGGAGGLAQSGKLGGALSGAAGGAAGSLLPKIPGVSGVLGKLGSLGKGALQLGKNTILPALTTRGEDGSINGLSLLGKLGLGAGLTGLQLSGAAAQNRSANQWNQGLLNLMTSGLGTAESSYAAKQPVRDAAYSAIAQGLGSGSSGVFGGYRNPNRQSLSKNLKDRANGLSGN